MEDLADPCSDCFGSRVMGVRGTRGNAADGPEGRTAAGDDIGQMRWSV